MDTRIEADNPYRYDRYGYAWYYVPADSQAHLDFGSGRGSFPASLKAKRIGRLVGVDISQDAVRRAGERYRQVEFVHLEHTVPLPFEDNCFTSVTLMDVIEHVDRQATLFKR